METAQAELVFAWASLLANEPNASGGSLRRTMAPYRSHQEPEQAKEKKTAGLVADMVRQFADPHAFVRELVQNGIDANATRIDVVIDRTDDGITSVRAIDNGVGMTLDIIENALLVLFRSTKDSDPTKIGKYGVGFMSVFAMDPMEVTVDTFRDGQSFRVRLFPDHSYEIERGAPRHGNGTTVSLSKRFAPDAFEPFVQALFASLSKWCRHAEIPIFFIVHDGLTNAPQKSIRVDTSLNVRTLVEWRQRYEDMEIVLGPVAGADALPKTGSLEDEPTPFLGFYNRGLTLFETATPPQDTLLGLRAKVKSHKLHHTLSRDDVRRDQAYHLALARIESLVDSLQTHIREELLKEAVAVAHGGNDGRFAALLDAAVSPPINIPAYVIPVPLAHPIQSRTTMTLDELHSLYSNFVGSRRSFYPVTAARTELSMALAEANVPCVWLTAGLALAVDRATGGHMKLNGIENNLMLVTELPLSSRLPNDDALCAMLTETLALKGISHVTLGNFHGATRLFACVPKPAGPGKKHVVNLTGALSDSSKWPRGTTLVLREDAEAVAAARRAAQPAVAVQLLARYLLLQGPGLSSKMGEALATHALSTVS